MTVVWPTFDELKQMSTYELIEKVLKSIYDQIDDNKRKGVNDDFDNLYISTLRIKESPYHIPEFGNFIPFDLSYTYREDREVIFAGIDGFFSGRDGANVLLKLEQFFFMYNSTLPGLFFFLNLLHLNNESRFDYSGVILIFFRLLTLHKLRMNENLNELNQHIDSVLSLFYKLLENPTFQLSMFFKFFRSDLAFFNIIGYALSITAPQHVQMQKKVWENIVHLDSPIIEIIKPWNLFENINWNNMCTKAALKEIFPRAVIVELIDGFEVLVMIMERRDDRRGIKITEILTEKGSREFKTRVEEIKKNLLNKLRS